jgi:hypothetical protein
MTAPDSLPLHIPTGANLAAASSDLLRAMVKTFADTLMSAEADALCNAEYGQVSDERVNHRNGYRPREWDTRQAPSNSPCPSSGPGVASRTGCWSDIVGPIRPSSRWSPPPACAASPPAESRSSQSPWASPSCRSTRSAKHLDGQVAAFCNRPLDTGPYAFVRVDALTRKVREGGRIINVHALIAVGVEWAWRRGLERLPQFHPKHGVGAVPPEGKDFYPVCHEPGKP